jgi:hypothetical protein
MAAAGCVSLQAHSGGQAPPRTCFCFVCESHGCKRQVRGSMVCRRAVAGGRWCSWASAVFLDGGGRRGRACSAQTAAPRGPVGADGPTWTPAAAQVRGCFCSIGRRSRIQLERPGLRALGLRWASTGTRRHARARRRRPGGHVQRQPGPPALLAALGSCTPAAAHGRNEHPCVDGQPSETDESTRARLA